LSSGFDSYRVHQEINNLEIPKTELHRISPHLKPKSPFSEAREMFFLKSITQSKVPMLTLGNKGSSVVRRSFYNRAALIFPSVSPSSIGLV